MIFEEQPETETLGYQFHVHQPSSTRIPSQLNWATSSFVFPFQLPPSYLLALVFRPLSSVRYFLKVHFLGFTPFLTFGRFLEWEVSSRVGIYFRFLVRALCGLRSPGRTRGI